MLEKYRKNCVVLVGLILGIWVCAAQAEIVTLHMRWDGDRSNVSAEGVVTLDVPFDQTGGFSFSTSEVFNFHLTIRNSVYGNGTYSQLWQTHTENGIPYEQPGYISFSGRPGLDFTKDLVGQSGFASANDSDMGGFYLRGPLGNSFPPYQTATIDHWWQASDELLLTSLRVVRFVQPTAVPEPSPVSMFFVGIGLIGAAVGHRKARHRKAS
jgi:hypothetical protein